MMAPLPPRELCIATAALVLGDVRRILPHAARIVTPSETERARASPPHPTQRNATQRNATQRNATPHRNTPHHTRNTIACSTFVVALDFVCNISMTLTSRSIACGHVNAVEWYAFIVRNTAREQQDGNALLLLHDRRQELGRGKTATAPVRDLRSCLAPSTRWQV